MAFNLSDYETVEERLEKFWKQFPDGRIETQLVSATEKRFIVQAWAYRTFVDSVPFTSGLAFEDIADRGVNATSALENAETSAIGRCLASGGFAAKGKRPSQTEMNKVQNFTKERPTPIQVQNPEDEWTVKTTEEPKPIDIAEAFKDEEKHMCKHGQMQLQNGIGRTQKPYYGYVCRATPRSEQCPPIWYVQTPSGKWKKPEVKE